MQFQYINNSFLRTGAPMFLSHMTYEFAMRQTLYSENLDAPIYLAAGSTLSAANESWAIGSSVAYR